MTCKHCGEPIVRCAHGENNRGFIHATGQCKGWAHAADGWHSCIGSEVTGRYMAEPEPGTLPTVETPTSKPDGAVA